MLLLDMLVVEEARMSRTFKVILPNLTDDRLSRFKYLEVLKSIILLYSVLKWWLLYSLYLQSIYNWRFHSNSIFMLV